MSHDRHHAGTAGEPGAPHSGLDLLSLAWRRKWLLVLGVVLGMVVGGIYHSRLTPIYQSSVQVLVVKKRPDSLSSQGGVGANYGYFEDYLGTHQALLKSAIIVRRAVVDGQLQGLRSFAGTADPTGTIIGGLSIARDTKEGGANNILILTYQGTEPADCAAVLDAVLKSYMKFLDEKYQSISKDTVEFVKKAQNLLHVELAKRDKAIQDFAQEKSAVLMKTKDGGNLRLERLVSMEARRLRMADRCAEIDDLLSKYEARRKTAKPAELLFLLRESPRRDLDDREARTSMGRVQRLDVNDQYLTLQMQEQRLLQDYGPDHPQVQAVRGNIEFLRTKARLSVDLTDDTPAALLKAVTDTVKFLSAERALLQRDEAFLAQRLKGEEDQARAQQKLLDKERSLTEEKLRTQQLYTSVVKRLEEINVVKDLGGFEAERISDLSPGGRIGPRSFPILSVAVFIGLLGALGLGYLVEVSDRSFRTPDDIRRRLGLPVAGCIPTLQIAQEAPVPEAVGTLAASLYVYHRPKSREAEAYRGVRTSLLFSARRDGCKIIQVTSPEMADGKTTLATNLAVAIAQSGKKVVLVDADFRRPRVHKLFGLPDQKGMASVLRGEAELADVRQPSGIPDLTIVACGPIPPNPAELLTSSLFAESLQSLAADVDFVIVDTPPLLAVTDPSVVVPCVDGVILTIRLTKNARPSAERAKDLLESMGAKVLGVVVNDVTGRETKGYGYGSYTTYGASGSYYAEDDASQEKLAEVGATAPQSENGRAEPSDKTRRSRSAPKSQRSLFRRFFNW